MTRVTQVTQAIPVIPGQLEMWDFPAVTEPTVVTGATVPMGETAPLVGMAVTAWTAPPERPGKLVLADSPASTPLDPHFNMMVSD